jgi:hypothetical protein
MTPPTERSSHRKEGSEVLVEQPPSTRLQLLAWYFALSGGAALAAGAYHAIRLTLGGGAPSEFGPRPVLAIAFLASAGVSWLLTGVALFRRQRFGAVMALIALFSSLGVGYFGGPVSARDVVFFGVSVALLASAWRELRR